MNANTMGCTGKVIDQKAVEAARNMLIKARTMIEQGTLDPANAERGITQCAHQLGKSINLQTGRSFLIIDNRAVYEPMTAEYAITKIDAILGN